MDNKQIVETLKLQPLTEEEKAAKHILGRLYGPIATCKESTRNGRKYNRQLWETALADDVFNEKIANKCLFLELGHPADREEIDMREVCACIPEMPKIVDGDLYAYIDILDTINGRTLKTLCDYGFIPGISSRGSGDIMSNDEVDPETFFLETFDIVAVPAVKKARLAVCESLDPMQVKLRKALTESYNSASDEDRQIMKETLNKLDISLTEDKIVGQDIEGNPIKASDIPVLEDDAELLIEEADEVSISTDEATPEEVDIKADNIEINKNTDIETNSTMTIAELTKTLEDFDKNLVVEYAPIEIDNKKYNINKLNFEETDDKLVIKIDYIPAMEDNINVIDNQSNEVSNEETDKADIIADSAIDNGEDEMMESLKEALREKEELLKEVKDLRKEKTVSDTKVDTLSEELIKYKASFARTSELAANDIKLKKDIKVLSEQIEQKNTQLKSLQEKVANTTKLTESSNNQAIRIKALTESLKTTKEELNKTNSDFEAKENSYKKQLSESLETAKKYKAKFTAVLNKYIESKASMLGVRSSEITNRLSENYTLNDIDKVCEDLLDNPYAVNTLPFVQSKKVVTEAKKVSVDDDLKDLYDLAGLSY